MGKDLAAELEELSSVNFEDLTVGEAREYVARIEGVRSRLEATSLGVLARFETSGAWRVDAAYSVTNWLTAQVGTSKTDARRRMQLARHLESMPIVAAALRDGEITVEHARVLARCVANPRTKAAFCWEESGFVNRARSATADELANQVRSWMERVDQLFRRDQQVTEANPNDPLAVRPPAQRRAEALWELVVAGAGDQSNPRHREPLVNLYMDYRTAMTLELHEKSIHELEDRSVIPMSTMRLWRCECQVAPVLLDARKVMLSYGRTERYANREQRRALASRDRGCAVPGCDRPPQRCDAHHIIFWEDEGPTDIDNLCLLCRYHHNMVHTGALRVEMVDGHPRFFDSFGILLEKGRWRPPWAHAA